MKKVLISVFALAALLVVGAVAHTADKDAAAGPSLEIIKKLAGDWVAVGKDGKPTDQVVSSMRVTAAGSAVLEVLFPGTDHEMVTMYHQDGKDLVLTHYCALGNQPRMRATPGSDAKKLVFKFDGGANIQADKSNHMHDGTIIIVDENRIKSEWTRCEGGKKCETHGFELVRKTKK